ncbi:MAG TPA: hypothetical protein VFX58_17600, partial [Chitinophagaceae bacterium]|nr:hypothetical protein [Chitinophagaceae bacterium]
MNWYSFVFSEKKTHRLQRHFSFWLLWWAYFTTSYFHYEQAGLQKVEFGAWDLPFFIKSIMLLIIHITACYCFIDFLMPRYLFSAKYTALVTGVLFLGLLILLSSY